MILYKLAHTFYSWRRSNFRVLQTLRMVKCIALPSRFRQMDRPWNVLRMHRLLDFRGILLYRDMHPQWVFIITLHCLLSDSTGKLISMLEFTSTFHLCIKLVFVQCRFSTVRMALLRNMATQFIFISGDAVHFRIWRCNLLSYLATPWVKAAQRSGNADIYLVRFPV